MRELPSGTVVAGYRIERRLGAGGTGAVYLARHPRLPRHDALKIMAGPRSAVGGFRDRFRREARLASRLDHPNVVAIYDSGEDGDLLWIAMQCVDGRDAAELVREGGLPAERAIAIVAAAARGLDAAHAAGLLHRDVKPANILVTRDDRVLVADFGIAKEVGDTTATGTVAATPAYAAPEQITGGPLDRRADVYGLGATLYHLVTGQVPYPRETTAAMLHAQLSARPPRPSRAAPALPVALDAVIARALAKDPAQRYASCGELAEAARDTLGGTSFRRVRRIRQAAVAAVAVLAVTATLVAVGSPGGAPATTAAVQPTTRLPVSPWGSSDFIVAAFPELLPSAPSAPGYLGLTCASVDDAQQPAIVCTGDNETVWWLMVKCRTDRSPLGRAATQASRDELETWTRTASSGTAVFRTNPDQYRTQVGNIEVRFDSPDRDFCELQAYGLTTGRELYEQWWPTAPV
ncbi:serine/threonine-protein kinase [Nocardia sp. NPDC055029]